MKLSDFRIERGATAVRATARVTWERSGRAPLDLFYETGARFRDDVAPEPEAFLAACVLPAARYGERRIRVEGTLCPRLSEGLMTAAALLRSWFGPPRQPVEIEASSGFRALVPRRPTRCAFAFTGGVDSTHLLSTNRRTYPADHPASFADALWVQGNLRPESEDSPWNARSAAALARRAEARGLTFLPVRTNLWDLAPDLDLVTLETVSSAPASAAHVFRRRWNDFSIASGPDIASEYPHGTHPLLDPLYSSSGVEIRHNPSRIGRLDRVRDLAAAGDGELDSLIVCMAFPGPPHLNCGECEKCVRTMTQLLAVGRLPEVRSFRHRDVSPDMIRAITIPPAGILYWNGVPAALAERGRSDVATAVEEKLAESRRFQRWSADSGWKGWLRRLDRRLLGGRLLALRRRLT